MSDRIYDRIRIILETTPGLTQKGLAERMGLNPAAINRMLYGRRNIRAEEIPMIEAYLGVRLDLSSSLTKPHVEYRQSHQGHVPRRSFSETPAHFLNAWPEASSEAVAFAQVVPVYSCTESGLQAHQNMINGGVIDWAARHPAQFGIANAFATYIFSDTMEPRYFRGELIYLHPGRPPEMNRDCLVEMKSGEAYVQRFICQDERDISVAQFNPPQEKNIAKEDIKAIYTVIGRS